MTMQTYVVGGAVRDALLGLPVQDHDHVVVGATPDDMLAAGFRPVGKDFPVFLHPDTQEEYALARTERKTAPGYHGFVFHTSPEVTLEDDLVRRDLTINAMARAEDGSIVDPYGGRRDLDARIFRHVSPAFAEDPVRILRLARFAARFPEFTVAEETLSLMRKMVEEGEVDALVPERVWQELARGLMENHPSRMLAVLRDCGALARIMPELDAVWGVEADTGVRMMRVIDDAARQGYALAVRFAALMHDLGTDGILIHAVCKRLKVPNDCRDLALMTAREHDHVVRAFELGADTIVALFERCDGFRKPERFADMLLASECVAGGQGDAAWPQRPFLEAALAAARAVNAGEVAARCGPDKAQIPAAVHRARVAAVAQWIDSAAGVGAQAPHAP
jgi:tRNA nucleotidyltransferase (CCA-adding enzyme)